MFISALLFENAKNAAAVIAVQQLKQFQERFEEIIACCFSEVDVEIYERLLGSGVQVAAV